MPRARKRRPDPPASALPLSHSPPPPPLPSCPRPLLVGSQFPCAPINHTVSVCRYYYCYCCVLHRRLPLLPFLLAARGALTVLRLIFSRRQLKCFPCCARLCCRHRIRLRLPHGTFGTFTTYGSSRKSGTLESPPKPSTTFRNLRITLGTFETGLKHLRNLRNTRSLRNVLNLRNVRDLRMTFAVFQNTRNLRNIRIVIGTI